ncbi:MAG TPA: hypothetical protein VFY93_19520 [Planctomycetota bacterium]|nr:hypothetical protein [Planctomycetota bacterium]
MDDAAFVGRFEACAIPLEEWDHKAHLKVAWTYLRQHGLLGATERMRAGIRRFNASKGLEDSLDRGYHETLTVAWLRIVDAVMRVHGAEADATAFLGKHTQLHSKALLRLYYTRDRILSWDAKRRFVEPDLAPFPRAPEPT